MNKKLIWAIVIVVVIVIGYMLMKKAPVEQQAPVETATTTQEVPATPAE